MPATPALLPVLKDAAARCLRHALRQRRQRVRLSCFQVASRAGRESLHLAVMFQLLRHLAGSRISSAAAM